MSVSGNKLVISDSAPITARSGCTLNLVGDAECPIGVDSVSIVLRDRNDAVQYAAPHAGNVSGEDGSDTFFGGIRQAVPGRAVEPVFDFGGETAGSYDTMSYRLARALHPRAGCQSANKPASRPGRWRVDESELARKEPSVMRSPHTEGLQIVPVASGEADRLLLRLEGELDLATAAPLHARLREFDHRPLVLDLSGLTFTDSTGLAILLEERARARRQGVTLRIRGATGQTRDLLERTGVLRLFESPTGAD